MKRFLLNSRSFIITFVIVNLFLFSSTASAALKTWGGATGTGLSWTNGANWVGGVAPGAGDDIEFNTPGTITFSTMPAASVAYNSLTISDGNVTLAGAANITLTIGNAVDVDLSIVGIASLTLGTNVSMTLATNATATISGALTINAGRTYNTNGTNVVSTVFGTITNKGILTCTTAAKLLMDAGSAYVHDQDGGIAPIATWDVTSVIIIKGAISTPLAGGGSQSFGIFTYNSPGMTGTITMPTGLTVRGNLQIRNTGSGIVQMSGGSFTVNGFLLIMDDFRIAGTSDITLTVDGNVSMEGGTLDMSNGGGGDVGTLNVRGNFSHLGGTITETGSGSGSIVFSKAGTQTYTSDGGTVTNAINYTVSNGSTLQMADDATTVTGGGTFTLSAGATLGITSPDGITTAGTASGNIQTTARTFNVGANYLYNGTANQNTGTGYPTALTGDLIIDNPGNTVTLNAARSIANSGLVNIINGTLAAGTNLTMSTTSGITNSGGSMSGTLQGAGVYDVTFTGGSRSTSGELSGTGLRNVTVNMTTGETLTLNANRTISGKLTLTDGILAIPTGITFTIANANTNTIGGTGFGATKHVATLVNTSTGAKGFLRVNNMAASVAYLLPVGNGTVYLPVTLTPTNATIANNTYSACVFPGITMNGEPNGTAFSANQKNRCVNAVWTVNYNGAGTPTASPTTMRTEWPGTLEGAFFAGLGDNLIGISHYGPAWGPCQRTTSSNNNGTGNFVSLSNITTFSPFGVGWIDPTGGVLAIKITYFNASKGNGFNTLNWQAACSSSQAIFEIERSVDGINFGTINTLTASQARCAQPFNYTDNTAPSGTVYYRLKVVDVDGKVSYSAIVKLTSQVKDIQLDGIAPNPVVSFAQVKINTTKKDVVSLAILSMDGKMVYHSSIQLQAGTSVVNLDIANLPAGMYMIKGVFSDGQTNTLKFSKK